MQENIRLVKNALAAAKRRPPGVKTNKTAIYNIGEKSIGMKSEKRTTVYFEASSADRLCELLGAYDENLKTLSEEIGVEFSVAYCLTFKIRVEKENVVLC